MFRKFADFIWYLLPTPFKLVRKTVNQWYIFFRVIGGWYDEVKADLLRARDETTIATCSDEMLRYHGADRGLVQYEGETYDNFRGRIAMFDELERIGGSREAIILALNSLGFEDVEHDWLPKVTGEADRWSEFMVTINEDLGTARPSSLANVIREVRDKKESESLDHYRKRYLARTRTNFREEAFYESLMWSVFWENTRRLDGTHLLDGSHLLRGAIGNVSALTDCLISSGFRVVIWTDAGMGYLVTTELSSTADAGTETLMWSAFWENTRRLDGTHLLDGSHLLRGTIGNVDMAADYLRNTGIRTRIRTDYKSEYAMAAFLGYTADGSVETVLVAGFWNSTRRLDGTHLLDGSHLLKGSEGTMEAFYGAAWDVMALASSRVEMVPAHAFNVETASVATIRPDLTGDASFYNMRRLDGTHLLDGSHLLNSQAGYVEAIIGN